MTDSPTILQNALHIRGADLYLVSAHRHDFNCHTFEETEPGSTPPRPLRVCVDGGCDYLRRVGALYDLNVMGLYEEYSLTDADPFAHIADRLLWGNRGKNGSSPLTWRPLRESSIDHLTNILLNCPGRSEWVSRVVRYWLEVKERGERGLPPGAPGPVSLLS